jgi:hypothetical protein
MHNHDYELIMALAEGSLDPAAEASARAEIEVCPECAQDLELQVVGFEALQALPPAGLTELEAARLHRDLRRDLGITRQEARQPAARSRLPLAALGTAAAVLVAVVLVGPGLNLIGGGDSSSDTTTVVAATDAAAATTAAPALGAGSDEAQEGASSPDSIAAAEVAPAVAPTTAAPATTMVTTTGSVVLETDRFAYFLDDADLEALRDGLAASSFEEDSARSQALRVAGGSIVEEDFGAAEACIELTLSSEDNFLEGFQLARGQYDGREVLLIVYLAEALEESALIAHAADNCEELDRAGP